MQHEPLDVHLIEFCRRIFIPFARVGIFIVFFWFGFLKVLGLSPAAELVRALFEETIHFMPFGTFYLLFALLECCIGILFLVKGAERVVIPLLLVHMAMTFLPLFMLPDIVWSGFLVPTLEGQYIIKNIVIIAVAVGIAANVRPRVSAGVVS